VSLRAEPQAKGSVEPSRRPAGDRHHHVARDLPFEVRVGVVFSGAIVRPASGPALVAKWIRCNILSPPLVVCAQAALVGIYRTTRMAGSSATAGWPSGVGTHTQIHGGEKVGDAAWPSRMLRPTPGGLEFAVKCCDVEMEFLDFAALKLDPE